MFNKVLNVPPVFLTFAKNKFLKSEYYEWWKTNTTKLKLCSAQIVLSKQDLGHLRPWKCCVQGAS